MRDNVLMVMCGNLAARNQSCYRQIGSRRFLLIYERLRACGVRDRALGAVVWLFVVCATDFGLECIFNNCIDEYLRFQERFQS